MTRQLLIPFVAIVASLLIIGMASAQEVIVYSPAIETVTPAPVIVQWPFVGQRPVIVQRAVIETVVPETTMVERPVVEETDAQRPVAPAPATTVVENPVTVLRPVVPAVPVIVR